jgi:tetratricopeptide (TPR) repeat protein
MRKIILPTLLLSLALVFSACSRNVDKNLTPEKEAEFQKVIDESLASIKNDKPTTQDEINLMQNIASSYDGLGDYDQAIKKYESILKKDPKNYIALNNLTNLYEERGELEKAKKYVTELYRSFPADAGVLGDAIRVLVKNKEFDKAQSVLEDFATKNTKPELGSIISAQFEYIDRMRNSANK